MSFSRMLVLVTLLLVGTASAAPVVNFAPPTMVDRFTPTGGVQILVGPVGFRDNYSGCALTADGTGIMAILNAGRSNSWADNAIEVHSFDGTQIRHISMTGFWDTEGLCVFNVASNQYAILEEGSNDITIVTITGTTTNITKSEGFTLHMGLGDLANKGTEGLTFDESNQCFYVVKEKTPMAIYRAQLTATGLVTSILFDVTNKFAGLCTDLSDVTYDPRTGHLLVLSQESRKIIECDLQGNVLVTAPMDFASPEGIVLAADGQMLHVVGEPNEYCRYSLGPRSTNVQEGSTIRFDLCLSEAVSTGTVDYVLSSGGATADVDYEPASGTVSFTNGATSAYFTVSCLADQELELPESMTVLLTNPNGIVVGDVGPYNCTIADAGNVAISVIGTQQLVRVPFPVTVTAQTTNGILLGGYSGPVTLTAEANGFGSNVLCIGEGGQRWQYPLYSYYDDVRTQVIYLTNEIGGSCVITGFALNVVSVPGQILTNWTVRMKHTAQSNYASVASWDSSGWTTVLQSDESITSTGWLIRPLSVAFTYNGKSNLLVDFSFDNPAYSYTFTGLCGATRTNANRSLTYQADSWNGAPTTWGDILTPGAPTNLIPNIRFYVQQGRGTIPGSTMEIALSNGIWTGSVAIAQAATNVQFKVDATGHSSKSGQFSAQFGVGSTVYIQAVAGQHGSVSPSGTVSLVYGEGTTFVCKADSYFNVDGIKTNGCAINGASGVNSVTQCWANIQGDATLTASFCAVVSTNDTPEWWLAQHGWTNSFAVAALDDPDCDGLWTWEEYRAGTDPTNSKSVFTLEEPSPVHGTSFVDFTSFVCTNTQHDHLTSANYWSNEFCIGYSETNRVFPPTGWQLRWPSVTGRVYSVYARTNMTDAFVPISGAVNLPATPPENVFTNLFPSGQLMIRIGVSVLPGF